MTTNLSEADDGSGGITQGQLAIIKGFTISTSILGTVCNSVTILAILRERLHYQDSYLFILNLSICNLIHSIIFHPLLAVQAFHSIWTDNSAMCNAYSYGLYCNLGTELWGYVGITLNRYICVVHHHAYKRLYRNKRLLVSQLVFFWLFYPLVLLLPLTGLWEKFEYAPEKLVCHPFGRFSCNGYCLFTFFVAIATTVPVIFFCYSSIIHTYVISQKKVGLSRNPSSKLNMSLYRSANNARNNSERTRCMSEIKMAFTILAVISVFTSFRVPFMVLYLVDTTMKKIDPIWHTLVIFIGSNSNWINPIIYSFTNKQIFSSLEKMVGSWKTTLVIQRDTTDEQPNSPPAEP